MTKRHLLACAMAQQMAIVEMSNRLRDQNQLSLNGLIVSIKSALSTIGVICLISVAAILASFGPAIKMVLSAYILGQL